ADRFNLTSIVEGKWDSYIDSWAEGAHRFGKPFLVSLACEMNGFWFPWSGILYGAGDPVDGGGYAGPEFYKRAYRHIVNRVRAHGGTNVLWVYHVNNDTTPVALWNTMATYYPGSDYV